MKSVIILLLGCLIAEVKLDYSRGSYARSNYDSHDYSDSQSSRYSSNNKMNVKTIHSKIKTAHGRPHNFGGCTEKPPILMNAGMKCSQYSGCRAQCLPNHQFPNGQTEIRLKCTESKWQIDGADLDYDNVPSCEPMCLPGCQNNGICVAPHQCNCPENFSGPQCQFENKPCLNYPPMPLNAKRTCRSSVCTITCLPGHKFPDGSGISTMTCEGGNWRPSREGWVYMPDCMPTCNPPCLNGGNCLSFNVCQCPQEYRGPQCQYDVDACSAKKLLFNGGYNCSGNADSFSCSLSCPPGIDFEFAPAHRYSCTYTTGIFLPLNIPQCLYSDNMEVIPMGGTSHYHTTFYNSSSSSSSGSHSSGGHNHGSLTATTLTSDDESNPDYTNTNENGMSHNIFGGMDQNQYIVVEDKKPIPGVCFTWSATHYRTFDGKIYSFQSDCAHVMVRDTRDDTFSIVVANNDECVKNRATCYRVVRLYIQDKEYVLKKSDEGIPILTTGKKTWPIPGQLPGIRAEIYAHYVVLSLDTVGAKIKWDTEQLVQIEVSESLWNRTAGLCGNIDGDIRNDIVTKDGAVPKNVFTLASSWQNDQIGDECTTATDQEHGCDATGDLLLTTAAHDFCSKLLSDPRFHQCLEVMDIRQLLEACKWDFCYCGKEKDSRDCACNTINVYVRGCAHSGIKSLANWRTKDTCPMQCTGGRVYMQCAPSKGQAVCGASVLEAPPDSGNSEGVCEEGCYCPAGTVLHENKCITRDKCPCRLRGKDFPPGTSLPKDCNTCTCASGQWICTQVSCGARCAAIGDPHYVTFDGKRFDFMGQCSYYLVKHDNFTIEAENIACSGAISQAMNFPVNVVSGLPSCTKTLTLKMAGQAIHLKQNHELVVNGRDVMKIPHEVADIKIRKVSSIFMQVELPNDVVIWWDGVSRAYVDVPASFKQQTKGLCGTFNENQKDDFLTPDNDIEQSVAPFANKWKTEEKCNDIPDRLLSHPCNVNVQNKATAETHCQKLKSDLFADCHWFVDPEVFYQDCLYDMCSCETKVSKCLCPILSAYSQECSTHGVQVNWRPSVRECGIQCPRGQEYQVCGDSCARSCRDLSTRPECQNKRSQCVEGCNCPTGETLDEFGECIPIGRCDCWHDGLMFPPGYKEVRAASKAPDLCTCVNANWNCQIANDAEKQKYPKASDLKNKCDSSKNYEFTTCESIEPVTCKNMHNHEPVSPVVCHAGCQCKEGYVLDTKNKICVKPTECPCQHGGKSYKEKAVVQSDCNTCTCKNGKWDCTDRQCSAECTAWGDSHFKTFDGKMFDYQGQCDYVLAKGVLIDDNSFDISIQNVPCSSLGVACSKSITIKIGSRIQQESVTLTREKKVPAVQIFKRFTVRNRDLFVIMEAYDFGLIVMWDKGTRVYVKIDPRWKNKVKGLCGNYNDNEMDDFQTPSGGFVEASAQLFGDSWKLQAYCPEAVQITDTCAERPDRKLWALQKCGALKTYPFSLCHTEVNVEPYLDRCIFDSCACDQGGDCECLCTALAAYTQECNNRGVPIKWRSQHLCPIQCDERCSNYSPCVTTCPPATCDNLLAVAPLSRLCAEDSCVEGCEPKPCPAGHVYSNGSLTDCVPASSCRPVCMEIDDEIYYEGDLIEEDDCHRCYCSRGQKSCKGQPCPEMISTTPPSAQGDDLLHCKSGWTEWINQDTFGAPNNGHKTEIKLFDKEPVPDPLFMNSLKGARCSYENMTQIKCRSVGKHIHYKEAHDNVECSLESGLICTGSENNPCPDFEISIKCACGHSSSSSEVITNGSSTINASSSSSTFTDTISSSSSSISSTATIISENGSSSSISNANSGSSYLNGTTSNEHESSSSTSSGSPSEIYSSSTSISDVNSNSSSSFADELYGTITHEEGNISTLINSSSISSSEIHASSSSSHQTESINNTNNFDNTIQHGSSSTCTNSTNGTSACSSSSTVHASGSNSNSSNSYGQGSENNSSAGYETHREHYDGHETGINSSTGHISSSGSNSSENGSSVVQETQGGHYEEHGASSSSTGHMSSSGSTSSENGSSVAQETHEGHSEENGSSVGHETQGGYYEQDGASSSTGHISFSGSTNSSSSVNGSSVAHETHEGNSEEHGFSNSTGYISSSSTTSSNNESNSSDEHEIFGEHYEEHGISSSSSSSSSTSSTQVETSSSTSSSSSSSSSNADITLIAQPSSTPPATPDLYEDCDGKAEYKEHPTNCNQFYHCDPTVSGNKYLPKSCGEHMMFNPSTSNCDLPAAVEKIRPFCQRTTESPPISDSCEPGYILSDCAYECDRMCVDYLATVQQMQICVGGSGQQCDSGCVLVTKSTDCPLGHVWANRDTCVPIHDCMCRSADGEPKKPGSIVKVTDCEVCQCIDNFYACDNSACEQTEHVPESQKEEDHIYEETHTSVSESHVSTSSVSETEHHITHHVTPPKDCHPDMYVDLIQNDEAPLPDESFNASSVLGTYFAPYSARIDSHVTDLSAGSWSPLISDKNQWLEIRFSQQEPIYGIVIKGSPLYDQYVTSFKVLYSPDDLTPLQYVLDHLNQPQLFRGSLDGNTPAKHMFHLPIEAKNVRVNPQTWHSQIALRLELIGCGTVIATTPMYEVVTTVATPAQDCSDSMGLSEGLMALEQITISSAKKNFEKNNLKLNGEEGPWHSWQPITNSPSEYILFNLLEPRNVTGFISKGGRYGWVTAFKVKYSHNNLVWNPILENGQTEKVFPGNFDKDSPHTNKFPLPIMTTYIKIIPIKWMDNIQVRLELLGCYKPYPKMIEEITVATPTQCNLCTGVSIEQLADDTCHCKEDMWWDGSNCVAKPYCPCVIGHLTYVVGTSFVQEDCSDCICKLSGVPHCMPKLCGKCEPGLRSIVSSTCTCLCLPCGDDQILCPTTNICIPKASWCNGVQDCPDDEIDCDTHEAEHIVHNKTEVTSTHTVTHHEIKETAVQCAKITCPSGYKMIEKHLTPEQQKYMYIPTMFSTHGRLSYTKPVYATINGRKMSGEVNNGNSLDRPAFAQKKVECPEYTCIPIKPPPIANKDKPCPSATCPDGYIPNFILETSNNIVENIHCPQYECNPAPDRDSICNITGKSFSTFDGTIYNYDICDHILARDLQNGQWSITLTKKCDKFCTTYLTIDHDEHILKLYQDLTLEYDDFRYNVEQIKKIGSQSQAFSISKIGSMIVFVSNRYGVWVMWDKQGKVKVGVSNKLHDKVDGLCGFFNGKSEDDKRKPNGNEAKTTADFGDSWSVKAERVGCQPKACPDHIQNKALEMCKIAKSDVFSKCFNVINMDAFLAKCMDNTCTCLEAANNTQIGEDACRCQMLQNFVVDCMTSDSNIELMDWRTINDCPATCDGQLVHHDCYRRRCEPTCATISDPNACPRVDSLCFPGCYCPPGLVRHQNECVKASTCRDCECNVLPHLQYVTYDQANYTVNGNCVYVMSRDKLEKYHDTHKYQVLVTNGPCRDNAAKMCVGKVTILYDGYKIHVFFDQIRNDLKLVVDSERIDDFTEISDWSQVRQTKSKHFKILLQKIQVEISVYFPSLGMSVKTPSHKYGGKMEGLCGDCNKYPADDMRMPDGVITDDINDFALSWLYDQLPGGQTKEQCANIIEECEPLPLENDPCVQLLDAERYGQCHPVLDPGMFVEWCLKESCGGRPEGACNAMSAYGRECLNSGFCVNWHSDLCPATKCPADMEYKQCGPSCAPTCENVLDKKELRGCVDVPTDGCFCPEGMVKMNTTCVQPMHCEVCDEYGHHNGDKWKQDACTECQCVGIALKCERQHCPAVDAVCDYGFTAIKLPAEPDQCCDKYVCVPAGTSRPTCDPPQKLTCGRDQLQKLETTQDGCQRFICQCKPVEDCYPVSTDSVDGEIMEPGMIRVIEHGGCCPVVKYECKVETCPAAADCIEFYTLKKSEAKSGECCPRYDCMSPEEQCIVELGYTQGGEGGERERTVYERQKLLKKVNSTWHDGPCRDCHCIQTASGAYHPSCVTTECPSLASHPDIAEYVLTAHPLSGQCCADLQRTACRHTDGILYQVGDTWTTTTDMCTEVQCVKTEKGVQKQTNIKQCDKHCEIGWEYIPADRECCGNCKQVRCVVDGHVRNVGEKWTSDDHCTKYECINKNGSMQIQSEVITCDEISADKLTNFLYKVISVPGKCCPKHEMIACREGISQYQIGASWPSIDANPCKTTTCLDQYGTLTKQDTIQSCPQDCAPGNAYFPPTTKTDCCGRCEPIACVLEMNGTESIKQPGENWTSPDRCTMYSCDPLGEHLFIVTSQQESCPDISDCAPNQIYTKGCCERCNVTIQDLSQCLSQEMSAIKSIGIIKSKIMQHGLCVNAEPLSNFTECVGTCHSSTFFNIKSGEHESICSCCQATEFSPIPVVLVCPDGYKFTDYISVPSHCSCQGCATQKQAINPLEIQARSLNSKR